MKKIFLLYTTLLMAATVSFAQKKMVTREYTYSANEEDSKVTARTFAERQLKNDLLREVGEFLQVEQELKKQSVTANGKEVATEDFSQKIMAITAGVVEMKILHEVWNGKTYYMLAEMTVDRGEVNRRIKEVLNDKQKTKELEEMRKRALAAEAEAVRLRQELAQAKNKNDVALKQAYQQQAERLLAMEYFSKGYYADVSGKYELAVESYQKAVSIDPKNAIAHYNMGNAYYDLQRYSQAITCYQKALSIDARMAVACYNMGNAQQSLKDYPQAISSYQKAVSIDPNFAAAHYNMGVAYYDLRQYEQAIASYQKAVSINPNDAIGYNNMGLAYHSMKRYPQAITCFQRAVSIDPKFAEAYSNMGDSYQGLQDYLQAIRSYQKALNIDSKNVAARKGILAAEDAEDMAWAKKEAEKAAGRAAESIVETEQQQRETTVKAVPTPAVDMTLGSVTWAAFSVNASGAFAPRPDMYTQFYAWGSNPCPSGWRLPTLEEFNALYRAGSTWANANTRGNAVAGRFYGYNHKTCTLPNNMANCIFLAASGFRSTTGTLFSQGIQGYYWSNNSMRYHSTIGNYLYMDSNSNIMNNTLKALGFNVRCVQ